MNYTENLQLPLYGPNDVTSYMQSQGWNGTMQKIDTGVGSSNTNIQKLQTDVTTLEQQMGSANDEINNLTAEVSDNTEKISGNTANIAGLNTRVTDQDAKILALTQQITGIGEYYSGVLTANESTIAIPVGTIADNTLAMAFTSVYGLVPETFELRPATGGQPNVAVMTFESQSTDVNITVWTMTPQEGGN